MMEVCIHHGAHEIGGSCVEVRAGGERIVLDVGRPLHADPDEDTPLLPICDGGVEPLAVLITHGHQDHWGLIDQVDADVPVFMGAATEQILREASFWTRGVERSNVHHLEHRTPFGLGPFRITPFLNDHSAFDAYSILVEAEGPRLFYTGDIRGHGRKKDIFEELLRKPPRFVDAMLMEGTRIGVEAEREDAEASEDAVETACAQAFNRAEGLGLVLFSAQNIDRLITIYRAALRADRDLVLDLYTASIAEATGNPNIPRPSEAWSRVKVYVPGWQRARVKDAGAFDRIDRIKPFRVFEEELAADPARYVMSFSRAMAPALDKVGALEGAVAIWSMWEGYLEEPKGRALQAFLSDRRVTFLRHHTSGHASVKDLQRLVKAVRPGRVIPIHTFGEDQFDGLFPSVEHRDDGEWWEVGNPKGPSRQLIEAFSWRIVAEMSARFPERIEITQTQLGGDMYDCLTMVLTPATERCEQIDLNRNGSAHLHHFHSDEEGARIPDFWARCSTTESLREPVDDLCRLAGLEATVEEVQPSTEESLCFSIMAHVLGAVMFSASSWRWETIINEWVLREDILEAFPTIETSVRALEDPEHRLREGQYYWVLMGDGSPVALMDVRGTVHFTVGTIMEVGNADPRDPILAMRHASEMLRMLTA